MSSEKPKNKLYELILFVLFIGTIIVWMIVFQHSDDYLHVYFYDVGQGDSTHVRYINNYDILIDGGPDKSVLNNLGNVMPFWDKKIDLVILTHPHSDHINGLIEVIQKYQIGEIYMTDAIHTSSEYEKWLEIIKDKKIPVTIINHKFEKVIDESLKVDFIWPNQNYKDIKVENLNNTSIVLKLEYNDFKVLLTGDIEKETQTQLLAEDIKSTIFKVPHHGSSNFSKDFYEQVGGDYAVIMVGAKNKFHHPSGKTLDILNNFGYKILRTDTDGKIEFISNGKNYWQTVTKK